MDDYGYWLFLMLVYLLSALMKRRQQKGAKEKLEAEDDDVQGINWEPPEFVKGIISEFTGETLVPTPSEEPVVDEILPHEVEEPVMVPKSFEASSGISHNHIHLSKPGLTGIDKRDQLGTLLQKKRKVKKKKSLNLFHNPRDIRMAVIYKEILDKPRALHMGVS